MNRSVNAPGTEPLSAEEHNATVQPVSGAVNRKEQTMKQRFGVARATFVLLALTLVPATAGTAQQAIQPLPPDGTYYGLTMADWAVAMLQWKYSLPHSLDPEMVGDKTGERAGIGQRAPVWFLPSFERGTGARTFTFVVPEGQAIMTVIGRTMFHAPPGTYTEEELLARGVDHAFLDQVADAGTRRLDGVTIPDLKQYRVITPVFTMTLPPDNLLNIPVTPGKDARVAVVAAGHFLLFPPLPVGKHVFTRRTTDGSVDFTMNLIVQKPNVPLE
jgi:hypothetical protein